MATDSAYALAARTMPLEKLAIHANSYAAANGLQVEQRHGSGSNKDDGTSTYQCAPISLLPNIYPAARFRQAQSLASPFNLLVDRISRDGSFLEETLRGVVGADPFTGKLLELYQKLYADAFGAPIQSHAQKADRLGITRSDYMLNSAPDGSLELKQVELNTIASSFAGLAVQVANLHRHLVGRFSNEVKEFMETNRVKVLPDSSPADRTGEVPINPALELLPEAMKVTHEHYKKRFSAGSKGSDVVILFVVQEGETNTVDQRMLEFALWETHGIPVVRMSLTKLHSNAQVDAETGALMLLEEGQKPKEVSLVYFRAGYAPTDYPDGYDGIEWKAREILEDSRATKCPSLGYHLAGTKKVQQEIARPGVLEKFGDEQAVRAIRAAFAGLYSLGNDDLTEDDLKAVKDVLAGNHGNYVLKPQREGGGYNFYGDDLAKKIRENVDSSGDKLKLSETLSELILMQRLFPPQQEAILLRAGRVEGVGESISELGCFGTVLASESGEILHNEFGGFLLRTKFSNVDEGGVASGFATLSSPFICE